jgi:hypothetical protein
MVGEKKNYYLKGEKKRLTQYKKEHYHSCSSSLLNTTKK